MIALSLPVVRRILSCILAANARAERAERARDEWVACLVAAEQHISTVEAERDAAAEALADLRAAYEALMRENELQKAHLDEWDQCAEWFLSERAEGMQS